ncbi:4-hydroxy-3-methylbut-2-enyl diphosphate reductase [Rhizomonospora bruguierae]|uniref:4-hydroxy-3-methylbut-2-enyl diphosphate reductase n=1 Tax=Rhizomonospora bruguierae TaxID=1581705 RepID=UPI001BCA7143|nr:4-hydroxy-3-methylbut-2-enyl diphosphate reductase [Micromonospora sp. NBRC 107566]
MTAGWAIYAPMRMETRALRAGLPDGDGHVHRTGVGARRARQAFRAGTVPPVMAVAGMCGGLDPELRPGDVVVADEVRTDALTEGAIPATLHLPAAPLLAAALRRRGLTVHVGPMVSTDRLASGAQRERLAATGALAADLESAWVLSARPGAVPACVRVVADPAPGHVLRPITLAHIRRALRSLPPVAAGLAEWSAAATVRQVLLASPRSFCAGVERAITVVEQALDRYGAPVYVRKQIVHNAHVVAALRDRGAVFVDDLDEVPNGAVTVFSAHGVAPAVRAEAADRQLSVIDGTCPLVTKVHSEARRFAGRGDTVLLVGHPGHEETEGTQGEAPDRVRLVPDAAAAERVTVEDPERVSYLLQTTLAVDEAEEVVAVLRRRFPALAGPGSDDICYATTNRQRAVRAIAAESDVVLVLGSGNSSNSRRLVEVAERAGTPAYLVEDADAIDPRWLAGATAVGVTAGASAPPRLVDQTVAVLRGLGAGEVDERVRATEDVHFTLPKEVRPA